MIPSRSSANLAAFVILAAVPFVASKQGLLLAAVHPRPTTVWPLIGIALPVFLVLGYRVWPDIFLVNLTTAGSAATSLDFARLAS